MALDPSPRCQDFQYSKSSQSPPSRELRSTYDSPSSSAKECAYPTSQRISLQQLQHRAKMYAKDNPTMERSCSSASRTSFGAFKRSVPGMKSLMPLKLLSPTVPQFSTYPTKRSTFGTKVTLEDSETSSDIGDHARDSLLPIKLSRRNRDTPIYSLPGSPIPSRAYFSEDDICFNSSYPGSLSDEDGIIQDFANLKETGVDEDDTAQNTTQGTPCTIKALSRRHSFIPTPRWSELSFQCSGEALFEDESAWLRSPVNKPSEYSTAILGLRDDDLADRIVESWLSDTSSSFEHEEEILACATALSPSKAQVIDLKTGSNHSNPTQLSLRIPKRSSSLGSTAFVEASFWETAGTPPITPSGPWNPDLVLPKKNLAGLESLLPQENHTRAMPSPPLSPYGSPEVFAAYSHRSPKRSSDTRRSQAWPLPSEPPQHLMQDVFSSLEATSASFPSILLQPESPCISAIRSHNTRPSHFLYNRSALIATPQLESPYGHEFPRPPSYQPTGRPRVSNYPSHRNNFSFSTKSSYQPTSPGRSSSLPILARASLSPPDLSPILRIFPHASDIMCSALYAYVLAYSFLTTLSPAHDTRSTHNWPSPLSPKAANLLGIPFQNSKEGLEQQLHYRIRIQAVQERVRKCIYSVVSVIDSSHSNTILDDNGSGFNNGRLFIRTLEEVVRGCEEGSTGGML